MSWAETPTARLSRDGKLRLTHGPIDVLITGEGPAQAVRAAYQRAHRAFAPVLTDLVAELPRLRSATGPAPAGQVAQRMQCAVASFAQHFVTPMAAVAGAVADHLLAAMLTPGHGLSRAFVNNGGDIALWTGAAPFRIAICEDPVTAQPGARATVGAEVGGVATSGWRGRSHSLGIADAVTVLARNAATADAAATLIANAVDLPGHPAITRQPANDLSPDSDLGQRLVTTDVGRLSATEAERALGSAADLADAWRKSGLITAACLACQGARRMIGPLAPPSAILKEPAHA
ncbi:UPF0280 family protein [Thalassococcus sp. BH17M4-6]|uniref:UPF0280 family protein n=1 Tax=Thalassococcus sp. BH17M4-6 TaxID=3413148 RepID=UPI003BDE47B6